MLEKILAVLAPSIERREFMEQVEHTRDILNKDTLEPYRTLVEAKLFQGNRPFKNHSIIKLNSLVAKRTGVTKVNFLEYTATVLSNISTDYEVFERMVDNTMKGTVIDKLGLTYRKITLMQVLGLIDFITTYSRTVLLYTLGKEIKNFKAEANMEEPFPKAQIAYLEEHAENFAECLKIFSEKMTKIVAVIDTVPDIVYDPAKEAAVQAQLGNRADPLKLGYVPVISDIFLFFGLRAAEQKAYRYLKAEQDRQCLELRIAQYRAVAVGKPDAVTDKLIVETENELRLTNAKIAKMRAKMGLDK